MTLSTSDESVVVGKPAARVDVRAALRENATLRWALGLIVLGVVLAVPVLRSEYILHLAIMMFLYMALSSSWNILTLSGQLTLGHAAFFGVSSYTSALLFTKWAVSPFIGMLAGGVMAAAWATLLGVIVLRMRGVYLAIASIAFAEALKRAAVMLPDLTMGPIGISIPRLFDGDRVPSYYLALAIALSVLGATYLIMRSRMSFALAAVRYDQDTASLLGVNPTKYKVLAFTISAFFAGLAGGFYSHYITYIDPTSAFDVSWSLEAQLMPIVGGLNTLFGPVVGAVLLSALAEYTRSSFGQGNLLAYGVLLVVVILFLPQGIIGLLTGKKAEKAHYL